MEWGARSSQWERVPFGVILRQPEPPSLLDLVALREVAA
jgi:hypothetical protein